MQNVFFSFIWGLVCWKQVSRARISNYIPQYLWDVITCPCPGYLPLAHKSSFATFKTVPSRYLAVIILQITPKDIPYLAHKAVKWGVLEFEIWITSLLFLYYCLFNLDISRAQCTIFSLTASLRLCSLVLMYVIKWHGRYWGTIHICIHESCILPVLWKDCFIMYICICYLITCLYIVLTFKCNDCWPFLFG